MHRPSSIQAIITTRDALAFQAVYSYVELGPFSQYEAANFIDSHFSAMGRSCSSQERDRFVDEVGHVPKRLDMAVSYLRENRLESINAYLESLHRLRALGQSQEGKLRLPEASLGLEMLSEKG